MKKLIIEKNTIYEVDEECLKRKAIIERLLDKEKKIKAKKIIQDRISKD